VSASVSVLDSHSSNSLLHKQFRLEAGVGIGLSHRFRCQYNRINPCKIKDNSPLLATIFHYCFQLSLTVSLTVSHAYSLELFCFCGHQFLSTAIFEHFHTAANARPIGSNCMLHYHKFAIVHRD